jgi:DNA-binding CsgD family transcriptional regulator
LRPRREGRETVIDPYDYPVAGSRRFITTQVAPVFFEGRCVGAAGIDIAVEEIPTVLHDLADDNPVETLLRRGFVFVDGGELAYCSARSRRLLARFLGPAPEGRLPPALARLLEAADETPAAPSLSFRHQGSELTVRPFVHRSTGRGLVLVERALPAALASPLSAREHEVLEWMTHGKTNAEIATILGISLHTVKRHVEKILQKLGVPNRGAAALSRALEEIGPATYPRRTVDPLAC